MINKLILTLIVSGSVISSLFAQLGMSQADCQMVYGGDITKSYIPGWDKLSFYKDSRFLDTFFIDGKCIAAVYKMEYPLSEHEINSIFAKNNLKGVKCVFTYTEKQPDYFIRMPKTSGIKLNSLADPKRTYAKKTQRKPEKKTSSGDPQVAPDCKCQIWKFEGGMAAFYPPLNIFTVLTDAGKNYMASDRNAFENFRDSIGLCDKKNCRSRFLITPDGQFQIE